MAVAGRATTCGGVLGVLAKRDPSGARHLGVLPSALLVPLISPPYAKSIRHFGLFAPPAGLDLLLLTSILALLCLGRVIVYSASAIFAQAHYGSSTFFLKRNLVYGGAGLVALYVGWRASPFNPRSLPSWRW